jgi:hypothetical protein
VVAHQRAGDDGGEGIAWLAPEGQCPHCDKRRNAMKAAMRKRRAADKVKRGEA